MRAVIEALIKAERLRTDFGFITEIVQRGKHKPIKFRHEIGMPLFLYEEMRDNGSIRIEDYYVDESAFFEFNDKIVTVSFINLYQCEDFHRKIDHYLIVKLYGNYPITRTGISKL